MLKQIKQKNYGVDNLANKREFVMLVGLPGSGKSTYLKNNFTSHKVVSRDNLCLKIAKFLKLTYNDLFLTPPSDSVIDSFVKGKESFGKVIKGSRSKFGYEKLEKINAIITKTFSRRLNHLINNTNNNIVVDMVNLSPNSRRKFLNLIKHKDFYVKAVVFEFNDYNLPELQKRIDNRPDKKISINTISMFMDGFKEITETELFHKVESVYNFSDANRPLECWLW